MLVKGVPGIFFNNIGYPSEIHLKLKALEIFLSRSSFLNYPIVLKLHTERGSDTVMLCERFKMIGQTKLVLRANEIARHLSLRYISDG